MPRIPPAFSALDDCGLARTQEVAGDLLENAGFRVIHAGRRGRALENRRRSLRETSINLGV